jgi:hypothetical protein
MGGGHMGRTLLLAFAVGFFAPVIAQVQSEPAAVSVCELVKNRVSTTGEWCRFVAECIRR